MRRLIIALLLALVATPAHADPISGAIAAVGSWWASLGAIGQIAIGIGLNLAVGAWQYLTRGSGKQLSTASREPPSVNVPERSGLLTRRRLYGEFVTTGGVFFQKTLPDSGSSKNDIYIYGVAISDGLCDSLVSVIVNGVECELNASGEAITAPWFDGNISYLKASFRSGADDQAMDPIIIGRFLSPPDDFYPDASDRAARWAKFRQRGVATVVVEMAFGSDANQHTELWGASGIPDLKFKVRGLKVYDPNKAAHDTADKTTWEWSNTATLCELDYLNADMGFGIPFSEIDMETARASAYYDGKYVPTLDGLEQRATINGEVFADEANTDVLSQMILQNRAVITRAFGSYIIKTDRPAEPVTTLHQQLIVGDIHYQNEPDLRGSINTVDVEFYPASKLNEKGEVTYQDSALVTADGQELTRALSLRFCDSPSMAQRLGYALLWENRNGRTLSMQVDIASLVAPGKTNRLIEEGDTVRVELDSPYDDINGLYRINDVAISMTDFVVTITMSGTSPDILNGWTIAEETAFTA